MYMLAGPCLSLTAVPGMTKQKMEDGHKLLGKSFLSWTPGTSSRLLVLPKKKHFEIFFIMSLQFASLTTGSETTLSHKKGGKAVVFAFHA
jgi:hypothetical protein